MQVVIISGSHRLNSQSSKVAGYLAQAVTAADSAAEVVVHDLGVDPLPMWDMDVWNAPEKHEPHWGPLSRRLQAADAIIVVAPEWNGCAPPAVKNLFLFAGNNLLAHKAGLLVSVSGSRNGAYPIAELRASGYKNTRICYIPEHVIVRDVNQVLNPGEPASEDDRYLRERIDYAVKLLLAYGRALTTVRETPGLVDHARFPNGM